MPPRFAPDVLALLLCLPPVLGASSCGGAGASEPSGPLSVERASVDRGRAFEGAVLEQDWEVEVNAPLALHSAKTDCGCTLARLERVGPDGGTPYELGQPLAAGERLHVRLSYDTRGRRGPASRSVTLSTAEGPVLALTLVSDVQPWLAVEPLDLAFARVREGTGEERAFEVRSESGEAFGLSASRKGLPPWVTVSLEPHEPDASGRATRWSGRVALGGTAPRGTYNYPVELLSDVAIPGALRADGEPRTHSASPSWTVQIVGAVALSSPVLEFGLVRAEETVARSLRLESMQEGFVPSAAKARLVALDPSQPFPLERTATVRTRLEGAACEIELTLAGLDPAVQGNFMARLVVETGHPGLPELEAIVRGVRAPDGVEPPSGTGAAAARVPEEGPR